MSHEDVMRERRDREVERSGSRQIAAGFATKIVGVSFVPAYPDNLWALDRAMKQVEVAWREEDWERREHLPAILVRNPDNAYDSNAIEVHIPALGDEWGMIGHLTRPIAARLAPELDDGVRWSAEVESVLINPDHMDRPGISIRCARVAEEET